MPKNEEQRNNKKYFFPLCLFIIASLLTWGTWVTVGVFAAKAETVSVGKSIEKINKDTDELQKGQKEMNKEIKENREFVYRSNEKIMDKLMEIQKEIKKK